MKKYAVPIKDKSVEELLKEGFSKSFSYQEYRNLVSSLAAKGLSTGPQRTEAYSKYTQLNEARMRRWDKTFKIPEADRTKIEKLSRPVTFLVLTESWCGDAAASLPILNKIAELSSSVELRMVLRDEHLELMDYFKTNNARSIPKLILWDTNSEEVIATWGPRPFGATKMIADYKEIHGQLTDDLRESLQIWYNIDKGKSIVNEVVDLLPLK